MSTPISPSPALRNCDLVMKGGITSGVVYPRAIERIARAFRFKNIGGASAGAIAAAAAAAAELGRQRGQAGSFDTLADLPRVLGERLPGDDRTMLFRLFQPQKSTSSIFYTCAAALGGGTRAPLRVLIAGCRRFWVAALVGAFPGALMFVSALVPPRPLAAVVLAAVGVLTALVGAVLAATGAFAWAAVRQVPRNFFGLATGMEGDGAAGSQALTPWLTGYLNALAATPAGKPLTFRDLREEADVNLEVMTTGLTHGRPYRLPFRDDVITRENSRFFFREEELAQLFPGDVVRWMKEHPRTSADDHGSAAETFAKDGFLPLPEPLDLPVVVAVRMSLSFPVLLSAVPLYAVDYSRTNPADRIPERCWFSDGGISSNFPIHFFDTLLPRWPTFGIDLTEKHPDHPAGFYMPTSNRGGTLVKWHRFDRGSLLGRLAGFLGGIVFTAKDWADNAQCRLPGFRDRIGQISLESEDGGLNLDMDDTRIEKLAGYGAAAGEEFVKRFSGVQTGPLNWANHRQVRLRSGLAAVSELLAAVQRSCSQTQPGDTDYKAMVRDPNPPSYDWSNAEQQKHAIDLIEGLLTAAQSVLDTGSSDLSHEAPRPRPELRMRPRV